MVATPAEADGPLADFCAELRRLVRACGLPQATIAAELGRTPSWTSDLLNGRRRTEPDFDAVRAILRLCAERYGPGGRGDRPPVGMRWDVEWWRGRYEELVRTLEAARESGRRQGPRPPTPAPPAQASYPDVDAGAAYAIDAAAHLDMGVEQAVYLLADGRRELMYVGGELLANAGHEPDDDSRVLDDLLAGFPERVRAARGLARAALLHAAQTVLMVALGRCGSKGLALQVRALSTPAASGLEPGAESVRVPQGPGPGTGPRLMGLYRHCARLIARLTANCPEFALTNALPGTVLPGAAGAADGIGLSGLAALLTEFAGPQEHSAARYAELRAPIASLGAPGPQLPSLASGYINPRFRLAPALVVDGTERHVASDKWWEEQPTYDTLESFLTGHLLSLPALLAPLVILGHPGAGKSLLTKLLKARLPAREFHPLRVELRHTPADADLQTQLEHAIRQDTRRRQDWPDWSESRPGAIPVVLLDGFDELLQAGAQRLDSVQQWTYLSALEEFQRQEARLGRPLIVIVTSRTVVADRAEIPRGSQVLRLEPFAVPEIERWLTVWNTTNAGYLEGHRLRPLTPEVVLPHGELAAQPLLLLMLALYDTVGNALHRLREEDISRTQLYDRLLTEFVRRQVVQKNGSLPPAEAEAAIERELHRLSVIALGMFHRGAQAISGEQADDGLRALDREPCTSDLLFGRFFFVHESQAVVTEQRLRSYEFMHATFGEHLVARLIDRALRRLGEDDGELYALLSFTPLTDRAQLVRNLRDRLASWPSDEERNTLAHRLIEHFREAAWDPGSRTHIAYAPSRLTRTHRDAVYEANLLLVAVLAAVEVRGSQLFGSEGFQAEWRRHATSWEAQFSAASWEEFTSTLSLHHRHGPDPRIGVQTILPRSSSSTPALIRRIMFAGDPDTDHLVNAYRPLLDRLPNTLKMDNALAVLLAADWRDAAHLSELYEKCANTATRLLISQEHAAYLEIVLRQLVHDAPALPDRALTNVVIKLASAVGEAGSYTDSLTHLLSQCLRVALERGDSEQFKAVVFYNPNSLLPLLHLSRSTHTWKWACSLRGVAAGLLLNDLLADLDLSELASTNPSAIIDTLRLAAELDLKEWLRAHTPPLLAALPATAFGLLRPSDLPPLRAALPKDAYAEQFEEIEQIWRGPTPTPQAEIPAPHSPAT
ncbi:helix-turn-helix domain-containing protein [Streptomyces sp. NPDC001002]